MTKIGLIRQREQLQEDVNRWFTSEARKYAKPEDKGVECDGSYVTYITNSNSKAKYALEDPNAPRLVRDVFDFCSQYRLPYPMTAVEF